MCTPLDRRTRDPCAGARGSPSSEDSTTTWSRRPGSSPRGASRLRDSAGIAPASLASMSPGWGRARGSIPCTAWPGDLDRARHRARRSRRRAAAHRPAAARPRGAPAAPRAAARGRGAARRSTPSCSRTCTATTSTCRRCAQVAPRRAARRPARRRAPAAAARLRRRARDRARRGDRRRRARPSRATEARHHGGRGVVRRARAGARLRDRGHAPHLPRRATPTSSTACARSATSGLDLALVPIWGWGSRLGPGHLDPVRARPRRSRCCSRAARCRSTGAPTPSACAAARPPPSYLRAPLAPFLAAAHELAPDVEVVPLEPGESLEL